MTFLSQGSPGTFGEKEDFSDLPPNQRRKKLQAKIEEITGKVIESSFFYNLDENIEVKGWYCIVLI